MQEETKSIRFVIQATLRGAKLLTLCSTIGCGMDFVTSDFNCTDAPLTVETPGDLYPGSQVVISSSYSGEGTVTAVCSADGRIEVRTVLGSGDNDGGGAVSGTVVFDVVGEYSCWPELADGTEYEICEDPDPSVDIVVEEQPPILSCVFPEVLQIGCRDAVVECTIDTSGESASLEVSVEDAQDSTIQYFLDNVQYVTDGSTVASDFTDGMILAGSDSVVRVRATATGWETGLSVSSEEEIPVDDLLLFGNSISGFGHLELPGSTQDTMWDFTIITQATFSDEDGVVFSRDDGTHYFQLLKAGSTLALKGLAISDEGNQLFEVTNSVPTGEPVQVQVEFSLMHGADVLVNGVGSSNPLSWQPRFEFGDDDKLVLAQVPYTDWWSFAFVPAIADIIPASDICYWLESTFCDDLNAMADDIGTLYEGDLTDPQNPNGLKVMGTFNVSRETGP